MKIEFKKNKKTLPGIPTGALKVYGVEMIT